MQDGNKKYGRLNWRKGMSQEVILDSLLRHIQALRDGEVFVPDSEHGATHWDAIMSNAMMLSELRPAITTPQAPTISTGRGAKGFDEKGYCLVTGFNNDGWHRTHDPLSGICNCPSCR